MVFSNVLCGLSGAKVTRPSTFRSCQHGYAVKSALKAEDGLLYPLEKAFFFLPKPPTLILYKEVCVNKKEKMMLIVVQTFAFDLIKVLFAADRVCVVSASWCWC